MSLSFMLHRRYVDVVLAMLSLFGVPPPPALFIFCICSDDNRAKLGAMDNCISRLISLCSHPHPDVTRNAAAALGNLGFQNPVNQKHIGEQGGIDALLQLCQVALAREGMYIDMQGANCKLPSRMTPSVIAIFIVLLSRCPALTPWCPRFCNVLHRRHGLLFL